jgi:hypothetical protein
MMMCRPDSSPFSLYCERESMDEIQPDKRETDYANLLLGIAKQLANVLFTLPDKLVQDLWTVDDLRFARVQHLADLSCHECLSRSGRSEEQDTYRETVVISDGDPRESHTWATHP